MAKSAPVVYLLHGDDEFAIAQFVSGLEDKLGDPVTAAMNITRLDGRSFNMDELLSIAAAMPFLSKRRLVVLTDPLVKLTTADARQRFLANLERVPPTTALILIEYKPLTGEKQKRYGKKHWLEKWAEDSSDRVLERSFPLPKGAAMERWIQEQAKAAGGQFTSQAAGLLASLVGDDPRMADQEIHKLLMYVNYRRPVEPEDVKNLTADMGEGDIFAMVDALGSRDGRRAMRMLHILQDRQDSFSIFSMVIRQFRLLLLARELLDSGGQIADIARELRIIPYVADKVHQQARQFSLAGLENIYRRLVVLDEDMKTGNMEMDLALDTLVAALTSRSA